MEPSYCDPDHFEEKEIDLRSFKKLRDKDLKRTHAFKLGTVAFVGSAIGDSKAETLVELAKLLSKDSVNANQKYCTWYLNHPSKESKLDQKFRIKAVSTFNHKDIEDKPSDLNPTQAGLKFMDALNDAFDQDLINFLNCAVDQHYLALGCNGMSHRGPTVFGMVLAFSGCSPEHSLVIANQIWGLNGLKKAIRLAVIQKAYELGNQKPESRKKLAHSFGGIL